jgi:outer membrane receptor protein involved in Fe transport
MKRHIAVVFIMSIVLAAGAAPAASQSVTSTSGAITGRVVDDTGGVLPGVAVTVSSPAMMGTRTATTEGDGSYRCPAVPPGVYTVAFELSGFRQLERSGIQVGLGFTATVNAELKLATMNETVVVTGESPVVDAHATSLTSSYSADAIKSLPTTGEYWALLSVTPAVQMSAVDVGGSQALTPTGYTVYGMSTQHRPMVEGIVSTWGSGGSDMYYADFNSFSEVALNAAGNGAESPSPGMQSNYISKSGGNQYHGSFMFEGESGSIQAHNIDDDQIARGLVTGAGVAVDDVNRLIGYRKAHADIGGYILRDRLWWYASFSRLSNEVRLTNTVESKKSIDPTQTVKFTYNLPGNGRLIGYYQNSHKQVNPYNTSSIPLRRLTAGTAFYGPGTAWDQSYPAGVYKGEYSKVLSNNSVVEVRAGNWYAPWKNYSLAPDQYRYEDIGNGNLQGGAPYYEDLRSRPQLLGSLNYYKKGWIGSHDFKVGGELLRENDDQYDGGTRGNMIMILRSGTPIEVYLTESPNQEQSGLWARSLFVTDQWQANPHLTFDLGVRYDGYRPFLDAQSHTAGTTTTSFDAVPALLTWNNWAPRLGVVYDLTGKAKTVVKGNYGMYWWNPASDFAATLNPNQVFWWKRYNWTDANNDLLFQPNEIGTLLQTNGGVASQKVDPNLRNQYTIQTITSIEHEVVANWGVRAGFVWMGNRNLRTAINQNQPFSAFSVPVTISDPGPDGRAGTADDGASFPAFNLAPQYVGLPTANLTQNLPGAKDDYYTLEFTGNRRMNAGWSLQSSFAKTWSYRSALPLNPNVLINRPDGQDQFTTWQVKVGGTFQLPKGFRVSPLLRHQSGNNFGRTFVATLNYGSVTTLAEPFNANRIGSASIVDIRAEKSFTVVQRHLGLFFDVYNIFNANPETNLSATSGATWLRPLTIVPPRIAKVGVKFDW